jgi:hypothetical protein
MVRDANHPNAQNPAALNCKTAESHSKGCSTPCTTFCWGSFLEDAGHSSAQTLQPYAAKLQNCLSKDAPHPGRMFPCAFMGRWQSLHTQPYIPALLNYRTALQRMPTTMDELSVGHDLGDAKRPNAQPREQNQASAYLCMNVIHYIHPFSRSVISKMKHRICSDEPEVCRTDSGM